jgi:Pyridoxamine 5'-phosphate oxidase
MATWGELEAAAPELAGSVRAAFDAHKHKTMATLRSDGSPRLSGMEALFRDGRLWLGMMDGSRKARDLLRDPRLALHSATVDPELAGGDGRISGRARPVTDPAAVEAYVRAQSEASGQEPPGVFHLFTVDVTEVVLVRVGEPADHLVIDSWTDERGLRRIERR